MIILPDQEGMLAALTKSLPANLHAVLADIVAHAAEAGLLDLTYIIVVERQDSEQGVAEELGFSPLTNPIDGIRYDQPGFFPWWAYLRQRGRFYELAHTVSNDGFAFILIIDTKADSDLVSMCRRYGGQPCA
jgi:hypothetical protein